MNRRKLIGIISLFLFIMIALLPVFVESKLNTISPISNINLKNNSPPYPPEITGETHPTTGDLYEYSIVSTDPDGDNVSYYIEFGTGDFIITNEWYSSGETIQVSYIWREIGTLTMRAKAQDIYYAQSDWGALNITISGDESRPVINIIKPEKALYIMDHKIRKFLFRKPLIIGDINIEVNTFDNDSEINKVEFFIDGELKVTISTPPYSYMWSRDKIRLFNYRHLVEVIAYDSFGNSNTDKIEVWKFL
jgi:hypothetical protein